MSEDEKIWDHVTVGLLLAADHARRGRVRLKKEQVKAAAERIEELREKVARQEQIIKRITEEMEAMQHWPKALTGERVKYEDERKRGDR